MRQEQYFYCHCLCCSANVNFIVGTFALWSKILAVWHRVLSCRPSLRCISVTGTGDGSQGLRLCPILLTSTVRFCKFTSLPYVSLCDSVCPYGWRHLPGLILLFSDGRMNALRSWNRGGEWMHSDNSVKHKKWLLAVPDAAGYPHPVHILESVPMHSCTYCTC